MTIQNKSFGRGIVLGFMLGLGFVMALGVGGFVILNHRSGGRLSEFVQEKTFTLIHHFGPLNSLKGIAHKAVEKVDHSGSQYSSAYSSQKLGFTGSRVEKSGDLISWIAPFSERVWPDVNPPRNKILSPGQSRPIRLVGLRGEVVSIQVVLRGASNLDGLTVGMETNPPFSNCIRIHRFRELYTKLMVHQGGGYGPLKEVVIPDPLVPFTDPYRSGHVLIPNISLQEDINQPIWIDVKFNRSCQPGNYSGFLEIREEGTRLRKTPVTFQILNATLPEKVGLDRWSEIYFGRFMSGEFINNDQDNIKMFDRYFKMGHQYGFSTNSCQDNGPNIQWDWNTGKPISVDWSRFDFYYGRILSGELTGSKPNAWCFPIPTYSLGLIGGFTYQTSTPSPLENWDGIPKIATGELAKLVVRHWKEKGWPLKNGFVYVWDEPDHQLYYSDIYRLIGKINRTIHQSSDSQLRVMVTDTPYVWNRHQEGHDKKAMTGVDIWAPAANTYIPDRLENLHQDGKRTWFYQGSPPFLGETSLASEGGPGFRMWFWTAWKYHVNGVFYWASTFWNGNTKAQNPYFNGGANDGVLFYPGRELHFLGIPDINGPVPSIRMAQWRRGFEDYKYFYLLKQKGQVSKANRVVNNLVKRALDDGGYIPYWRNPLWQKPGDWNHDPRAWHQARRELAKEIDSLTKP